MDYPAFQKLIERVFVYFKYKNPDKDTVDIWYNRVKNVNVRAIPSIEQHFQGLDNVPRNVPKAMMAAYNVYQQATKTVIRKDYGNCDFCLGEGFLLGSKFNLESDTDQTALSRCGHCENWRNSFGENAAPLHTVDSFKEIGFNIDNKITGKPF